MNITFGIKRVLKLLMLCCAFVAIGLSIAPTAAQAAPQNLAPVTAVQTIAPVTAQPTAVGAANATIVNAAYAQLGATQDCTMLVTNALAAAGISFHDWPAGYTTLGPAVSPAQAVPGDLVYYASGHIAVYAGNGQAIHGGFNGDQTVAFSVHTNSGSPTSYIRVKGGALVATQPAPVVEAPPPVYQPASASTTAGSGTHVVAPGETLSSIAQAEGLGSWQQLWDANPHLANPNMIYVGQVLTVP